MNQINDESLQSFFSDLGLNKLDPKQAEEVFNNLAAALLEKVFIETVERLDEKSRDEYENLINRNSGGEEIEKFLNSRIADYPAFVQRIVDEFKTETRKSLNP